MDKQVVISYKTVIFTALFIAGGYLLVRLGPLIGLFFLSLMVVICMEPFVQKFMRITVLNAPLPRAVSVFISYILLITFLVLLITVGLPPFIVQIQKFVKSFSGILGELDVMNQYDLKLPDLIPQVKTFSEGLVSGVVSVFSNITSMFTMIVLSLYMSLDWENLKRRFLILFPDSMKGDIRGIIDEIQLSVAHWVKGELTLMLIVGLMTFVGLLALDVDYAVPLALVSGLLEVVPMIGPIVAAVIAGIVGFADSPVKGIGVVSLYLVVQQLENNLLVPKVMQKVSGFSPLVILIALMVGSEFFGISGAIMAVPVTMIVGIIIKRFLRLNPLDE